MTGELTNERMLVTGGAGFIGSNFVRLMLELRPSLRITVFDKLTYAGNMANLDSVIDRIKFVEGDVTKEDDVDKAMSQADIVVHFAAESHNDNALRNPMQFVYTNVVGTANILEAARVHDVRVHLISTDEVYGDLPLYEDNKFTLDMPYNPSSWYSASKAAADQFARASSRSFKIRMTISNCSNNYGPRQHIEKFIPRMITNVLDGRKPRVYGKGEQVRDWIHVDDHNLAVLAILERGDTGDPDHGEIGETYLIGADCQLDNRVVVELILELMGKPIDWFDEVADRPGHDQRYAIDPSFLMETLGWVPLYVDFRNGLANTIDWYTRNQRWWRPRKAAVEAKYAEAGQ